MKILLNLMMIVFLFGCGYKPVSKVSDDILGDNVWVDVIMSKTDPQNTVAIKDSIREGIIKRLGKDLAQKDSSETAIVASIASLTFNPIIYDQFGYATAYKANLVVNFRVKFQNGEIRNLSTSGEYDFQVTKRVKNTRYTDSIISDKDRYEAIKNASSEAFGEFISKLAIEGFRNGKHN
ncbi:putative lipooligosaccharide transport system, OM component (LptE family) [Campylobacter iguaniorum]|uniref:Putative lipooligosaccharide transport system, OM component (LptE family) n=1 Tax=Campylobacter iguaniorum TaxID=1244531 RepID=A0A076FFK2_9BACT|nr:LPS assembly lipoprotein LptE [Campylobacter iguaniorum]AII14629.1 putative lipooligosaccharide transport system, OM component (LptE family) [Campylobacter iguaniorum]ALV24364.1 putative lipooligosaccharide transport system, OM component (LptE family) [Campylobacter iguaniorum]